MMQDAFARLCELDLRLRHLRVELVAETENLWRGLAVRVGDETLLIPQADISEVVSPPRLTPVPNTRAWLAGVGNVRGMLLTLIDLRLLFGDQRGRSGRLQRALVLNTQPQWLAFLVDEVIGGRSFDAASQRDWVSQEGDPWMAVTLGALQVSGGPVSRVVSLHKLAASDRVRYAGW